MRSEVNAFEGETCFADIAEAALDIAIQTALEQAP